MAEEVKTQKGFSLKCDYYDYHFSTIDALINHVVKSGMDPNYEITLDGNPIGETVAELIVE